MTLFKDEMYRFYRIALIDLLDGVSIDELELYLKLYEEEENYEACAGILKAIEEARYDTIQNIREKRDEH